MCLSLSLSVSIFVEGTFFGLVLEGKQTEHTPPMAAKVLAFERGDLVFVVNLDPNRSFEGYQARSISSVHEGLVSVPLARCRLTENAAGLGRNLKLRMVGLVFLAFLKTTPFLGNPQEDLRPYCRGRTPPTELRDCRKG